MKTFKQFISEQVEQGVLDQSGVPNVLIQKPESLNEDLSGWGSVEAAHTNVEGKGPSEHSKWQFHNHNPHLGEKIADVHKTLTENYPISDADREHLHRYTKSSGTLNRKLFVGHVEGSDVPTHVPTKNPSDQGVHDVRALDRATSVPLTHDLHVHTGVQFHPGEVAAKHPEGHVHLPAFTSTSINPSIADSFAGHVNGDMHVLHVHLKPGDRGRYAASVSHFPHEKEFVLPRNTTLKIHSHPEEKKDMNGGTMLKVWHAHVVNQDNV